jgi:hypothetical protein
VIRDLIAQDHPEFSGFCKPFKHETSLQGAAYFAKGYIEACSSPLALKFDPTCEELGGHIHVATITPQDGFRWVIPPKGSN